LVHQYPHQMRMMKGGGSRKMMRQLEAMKGKGGFPGM
jgi:signal recognition particle subunit SRP54